MSLLLRKQCQITLDQFNLTKYHVDIDDAKHLKIVTECGKPLVHIHGVRFNRMSPNEHEIEFASTLLDNFMGTHSNLLKEYIDKQEVYKKTRVPVSDDYDINFNSAHRYNRPDAAPYSVDCTYEEFPFIHTMTYDFEDRTIITRSKIMDSDELKEYNDDQEVVWDIRMLSDAKCSKAEFNAAKKYMDKYIERERMERELANLLQEISSCDI